MSFRLYDRVWGIAGRLTGTEKLVLLNLVDHDRDAGAGAFPAIETIAKETGWSRRTVSNALASLKRKGFITRIATRGRSGVSVYLINRSALATSRRGEHERGAHGHEGDAHASASDSTPCAPDATGHEGDAHDPVSDPVTEPTRDQEDQEQRAPRALAMKTAGIQSTTSTMTGFATATSTAMSIDTFKTRVAERRVATSAMKPAVKVLTALAHDVLDNAVDPLDDLENRETMKVRAAQAGLLYDGSSIVKAVESATNQRDRRNRQAGFTRF